MPVWSDEQIRKAFNKLVDKLIAQAFGLPEEPPMPDPIPQKDEKTLERLIKLLAMSTSSNSAEALAFLQKAHDHARALGGWEKLLRGRVTIVGDPFNSIPKPTASHANHYNKPAYAPQPPTPQPSHYVCHSCTGITRNPPDQYGHIYCTSCIQARAQAAQPKPPKQWRSRKKRTSTTWDLMP